MIHIHRLTMLSYGAISCYSPCWFPFAISPCQFLPFLGSLLLTWNPSSCVVRSRPPWPQVARELTSPFPSPPHSKLPSPQGFPSLIVRPTKTTSRSRLHIVWNTPSALCDGSCTLHCSPTFHHWWSATASSALGHQEGDVDEQWDGPDLVHSTVVQTSTPNV
jgi:hypothetical protein